MQYLEFYIVNYLLNISIISHSTEKLAYLKHTIINNQDSYVTSLHVKKCLSLLSVKLSILSAYNPLSYFPR